MFQNLYILRAALEMFSTISERRRPEKSMARKTSSRNMVTAWEKRKAQNSKTPKKNRNSAITFYCIVTMNFRPKLLRVVI